MNFFEVRKALYLNRNVLRELKASVVCLRGISDELDDIAKEDDNYAPLRDAATGAWANLTDFLNIYDERDK